MTTLGRLERVELRDIWVTEAQDFTPWLAREENLKVLADAVNMDLELEAQEKNVGPFRADILCRNSDDGSWVLIENQLERTDHGHLGQLLTYASGLDVVTIVWVAAKFTDEHRASLDWLNEITDNTFRFFGLEVELWRIGDSPAALKFNVVSKPNDWTRTISQAARRISEGEISEVKAQQFRYWTALADLLTASNSTIKPPAPPAKQWYRFGIGRSGFRLTTTVHGGEKRIRAELYISADEAKDFFHLLEKDREAIETAFGQKLEWHELPNRNGSRIAIYRDNCDPTNEDDWPDQHAWLKDTLERLDSALRARIKSLNADDWQEDSIDEEAAE